MESQLTAGYRDLGASLRKIQELLEWLKLFEAEKVQASPNRLRIGDQTLSELKLEIGWFYRLQLELEMLLKRAPNKIRQKWETRAKRLWKRYWQIVSFLSEKSPTASERFNNP